MIDLSLMSIKSWVKISFFMFGLWKFFWIMYGEVGTVLVAYDVVPSLPYVYEELYEGK